MTKLKKAFGVQICSLDRYIILFTIVKLWSHFEEFRELRVSRVFDDFNPDC